MQTIGLISPGAMGAAVAANIKEAQVIWAGRGRSAQSHARAEAAGLKDCGTLNELCNEANIILSVCPPHDAEPVAMQVAEIGFKGLFADCNAISPDRTLRIAEQFIPQGFVDGGIIGGPPRRAEDGTMLYLAGPEASRIAALFKDTALGTKVLSDQIGRASALKMVFAAYTKGTTALLTAILAVAEQEGVRGALETQWGESFTAQTHRQVITNSAKAWRFAGEMREIADTFAGAGLPAGFHQSAAEVFGSLDEFKDQPAKDLQTLLIALLD